MTKFYPLTYLAIAGLFFSLSACSENDSGKPARADNADNDTVSSSVEKGKVKSKNGFYPIEGRWVRCVSEGTEGPDGEPAPWFRNNIYIFDMNINKVYHYRGPGAASCQPIPSDFTTSTEYNKDGEYRIEHKQNAVSVGWSLAAQHQPGSTIPAGHDKAVTASLFHAEVPYSTPGMKNLYLYVDDTASSPVLYMGGDWYWRTKKKLKAAHVWKKL